MFRQYIITGMMLFALISVSRSSIIHVPDDYSTIQEAILASTDGDEILLADIVFHGEGNYNIDFAGKAVTVRSQSGNPEACIIDIQGQYNGISQRGFTLWSGEDTTSVIRDISIINGVADGP